MKPRSPVPLMTRAERAFEAGDFERWRWYVLIFSAAFRTLWPDYPHRLDPFLF